MKRLLFGLAANLAMFVALLGIQPTSWGAWYQPEVPHELLE
ncbi:MAG: cyclic lactone autoinducer peptide [Peptococcaceae bacterium]|nr:cyclic lactone autoinducer peptide [Peptococcaceae bacterium]